MSFSEGDLCSGFDDYGRTVSGVAQSAGPGGWVTLTPFERWEGRQRTQPPSQRVKASTCSVIERADVLAHSRALREQQLAGQRATWKKDAELRDRAHDIGPGGYSR